MGTIVTYTASLRTRRTDYTVNSKNSQACQEYYNNTYNYVGIVDFPGMNLTNKVITALIFDISSESRLWGQQHQNGILAEICIPGSLQGRRHWRGLCGRSAGHHPGLLLWESDLPQHHG